MSYHEQLQAARVKLQAAWSYFNHATELGHIDQAIQQVAEAEREMSAVIAGGMSCRRTS